METPTKEQIEEVYELYPDLKIKAHLALILMVIKGETKRILEKTTSKKFTVETQDSGFMGNSFHLDFTRRNEKSTGINILFWITQNQKSRSVWVKQVRICFFYKEKPSLFLNKKFKKYSKSEVLEKTFSSNKSEGWIMKLESRNAWEDGLKLLKYLLQHGISSRTLISKEKPNKITSGYCCSHD